MQAYTINSALESISKQIELNGIAISIRDFLAADSQIYTWLDKLCVYVEK